MISLQTPRFSSALGLGCDFIPAIPCLCSLPRSPWMEPGSVDFPIEYNGVRFPANTPLDSIYRFNSYRLSWRYGIKEGKQLRIGIGLTAKIRDAFIEISGGGQAPKNLQR